MALRNIVVDGMSYAKTVLCKASSSSKRPGPCGVEKHNRRWHVLLCEKSTLQGQFLKSKVSRVLVVALRNIIVDDMSYYAKTVLCKPSSLRAVSRVLVVALRSIIVDGISYYAKTIPCKPSSLRAKVSRVSVVALRSIIVCRCHVPLCENSALRTQFLKSKVSRVFSCGVEKHNHSMSYYASTALCKPS